MSAPDTGNATVAIIVAVLGAGGIGATTREVFGAIKKLISGVPGREDARKTDIVAQRDVAVRGLDIERTNRRRIEEAYADLRRKVIESGAVKESLPPWPDYLPPPEQQYVAYTPKEKADAGADQ